MGVIALMLVGRSRMSRLNDKRYSLPAETDPPHVTVLIPAKDEGAGVRECIQRVLAMDYPSFDVIAINDRSTDDTGAVMDEIAGANNRLRVVHITQSDFPEGWLGKCNALHRASRDARGSWLLFVDSDVNVEPEALRDTLALAVTRKYDALSILARLQCDSFIERLMLPLCGVLWTIMFRVSLTNNDRSEIAAANGQYFLIRREAYESVGGHSAVRDRIVEDVELMRTLKSAGFRTRLMFGTHLASTRMHSNLHKMFHGWGRIYSGSARRNPIPMILAMLFIVGSGLSVYPALLWGIDRGIVVRDNRWLLASVSHFALLTIALSMLYRVSRNAARNALFFPISAPILLAILAFTVRLCRSGEVSWRGSTAKVR